MTDEARPAGARPAGARPAYSDRYAAAHGRFSLVPAAYVFLIADERVLLQRRSGTGYYDGWWAASAAGHVEAGEPVRACAVREAAEEIGVVIDPATLRPLTTMHRTGVGPAAASAIEQRVDFFFSAVVWKGEPRLAEATADALEWFPLDELPDQVVHHERRVLELLAAGSLPVITEFGFERERES